MQEITYNDGEVERFVFDLADKFKAEEAKEKRETALLDPNVKSIKITKVGRNHPCPCGSGKKFKKCCIDKIRG